MAGFRSLLPLALAALAACGGGSSSSGGEAVRAPSRAGDVWVVDHPEDRKNAAGAVLALVNGLHVMVLDGDRAWAGMTALKAEKGPNGARVFALAGGLTAELTEAGEGLQLRFSTGETVPLRKQEDASR